MRLTILPQPKRPSPPALCVPSSFCLVCPIQERALVCFFQRPKPVPGAKPIRIPIAF